MDEGFEQHSLQQWMFLTSPLIIIITGACIPVADGLTGNCSMFSKEAEHNWTHTLTLEPNFLQAVGPI